MLRRSRQFLCSVIALLVCASLAAPARAQVWRDEFWVAGGKINDLAVANGAVYLGGDFTRVGPRTGSFLRLDSTTGALTPPLFRVTGDVYAVVSDGSGGWYIGGFFASVGNLPRSNLAHVDAAGNPTAWNPGTPGLVTSLARDPGTGIVYVGGSFLSVGGVPRVALAAVDSNGAVTAWDAAIQAYSVNALLLYNGVLYAGGTFTTVAGQTRNRAAAFDPGTGALNSWNPDVDGGLQFAGSVHALAGQLTIGFPSVVTIYLGGTFSRVGGVTRNYVAAVDEPTGALKPFNPGIGVYSGSVVRAIAVGGGNNPLTNPARIYVGGSFPSVGGVPRPNLAQLTEGGQLAAWDPGPDGPVHALWSAGNLVYVGGAFSTIGGQPVSSAAAIDRTTAAATSWNPHVRGTVRAITPGSTSVAVGGTIFTAGGLERNRLAAFDLITGQPTAWNPGADGEVRALAAMDGSLFVAGDFSTVAGQPRTRLAAFQISNGALRSWDPGADSYVFRLVPGPGVLYAGGTFTTIGGQPRSCLAALDPVSGSANAWDPSGSNSPSAITVHGSSVYLAGVQTVGGQTRQGLAQVDAATGVVSPWAPNNAPGITALAVNGRNVFVGGYFSEIGTRIRNNLAVVDSVTGLPTFWDHYTDYAVRVIEMAGSWVYIGGYFSSIAGIPRNNIAVLNAVNGEVLPWNPPIAGGVVTLKAVDGTVYVSYDPATSPHGSFAVFSGVPVGVADERVAVRSSVVTAVPNPFRSQVDLRFTLPRRGEVDVTIHDLSGRLIRRVARDARVAGAHRIAWDGRDESGHAVRAGLYLARVNSPELQLSTKILRIE